MTIRPFAMSLTTSSTVSNWNVSAAFAIIRTVYLPALPLSATLLVIEINSLEHEHPHEHKRDDHFALVATIASGRYMSWLLPWNSAFNFTLNCARSTRSQRVKFQRPIFSRGSCS